MEVYNLSAQESKNLQLVCIRRTRFGWFYLIWDTLNKMYIYIKQRRGTILVFEDAGTDEADAIHAFPNFIRNNTP